MKHICNREKCTGCHACYSICPKHCIEMLEDEYGFLYPKIDLQLCVNCRLCEKICPANSKPKLHTSANVYAAVNKNKYDYATTTSGGIATMLARYILEENGVVYGAAVLEDLKVGHIRVEDKNGIEKIKGSKYVQSCVGNSFVQVKDDLKQGRKVLFIGTPCQVSGLKQFIGSDNNLLYTCDIVCHGVPSVKMLMEHFASVDCLTDARSYTFRDKNGFYLAVTSGGNIVYRKRNYTDVYYLAFLKALCYRESCYQCDYATAGRIGDLTLGDFWGFDPQKGEFPLSTSNGLSLVIANTENGRELFDSCVENMVFVKREIKEAVDGNKQLRKPSIKHKKYEKFKSDYLKIGFEKAAKRALRKERIVYGILDKIGR